MYVNTVAEDQRTHRKALLPAVLSSHLLSSIISSIALSKQVKCLQRCIEVFPCTLYDGNVMWHNAFKHPSQTKRQMFFASWIFYWPAWFWELKVLLFSPSTSTVIPSLFSRCPFIHCDLPEPTILFPITFHTHNYCVITSDRKSVTVDVSALFCVGSFLCVASIRFRSS